MSLIKLKHTSLPLLLLLLVPLAALCSPEEANLHQSSEWPPAYKYEAPVQQQQQQQQQQERQTASDEAASTPATSSAEEQQSSSGQQQQEEASTSGSLQQVGGETSTSAAPTSGEQRSATSGDSAANSELNKVEQWSGGASKSRQSQKRWSAAPVFGRKRPRENAQVSGEQVEEASSRAAARHFYQAALESQQEGTAAPRSRPQAAAGGQVELAPEVSEIQVEQEPTRMAAPTANQQQQQQQQQQIQQQQIGEAELAGESDAGQQTTPVAVQEEKKPFIRLSNVATLEATANASSSSTNETNQQQQQQQPQMKLMRIYVIDLDQKLVVGDSGGQQSPLQALQSTLQLPTGEQQTVSKSAEQQVQPDKQAASNYSEPDATATSYEVAGEPTSYVPEGYVLLERDSLHANLNQVVAQLESSSNRSSGAKLAEQLLPQYRAPQYWPAPVVSVAPGAELNQTRAPATATATTVERQPEEQVSGEQVSFVRATSGKLKHPMQHQQQLDYWPTRANTVPGGEPAPQQNYHHKPSYPAKPNYSEAAASLQSAPASASASAAGDHWRPVDYSTSQHWQLAAQAPYANKLQQQQLTTTGQALNEPREAAYVAQDHLLAGWEQASDQLAPPLANQTLLGPAPALADLEGSHAPHSNRTGAAAHQQVRPHPSSSTSATGYAPLALPNSGQPTADAGTTSGAPLQDSSEVPAVPAVSSALRPRRPLNKPTQQQWLYKGAGSSRQTPPNSAYLSVSGPPVAGGGVYESSQVEQVVADEEVAGEEEEAAANAQAQVRKTKRNPNRKGSRPTYQHHHSKARPSSSNHQRHRPHHTGEPLATNELYSAGDEHYLDFRPPAGGNPHYPHSHHRHSHSHQLAQPPVRPYSAPRGLLSWETLSSVASGAAKRLPSLSSLLVPFGAAVGRGAPAHQLTGYPTANHLHHQPLSSGASPPLRNPHYDHRPYPFKFMSPSSSSAVGAGHRQPPAISYSEEPAEEPVDAASNERPQPPGSVAAGTPVDTTGLPDVEAELAAAVSSTGNEESSPVVSPARPAPGKQRPTAPKRPPHQKLEPAQEAVLASVELEAAEALKNLPPPAPVRVPHRRTPKRPKVAPMVPTAGFTELDADSAAAAAALASFEEQQHPSGAGAAAVAELGAGDEHEPPLRPPPHQSTSPQSSIQIGQFKLTPQTQFVQSIIEPSRQMLGQYFKQYIGQIGHTFG